MAKSTLSGISSKQSGSVVGKPIYQGISNFGDLGYYGKPESKTSGKTIYTSGGGSGGGGGGSTPIGLTQKEIEEQQRAELERQRREAESLKAQQQAEKERKKKIASGKISGQVVVMSGVSKPKTISQEYSSGFKSFVESTRGMSDVERTREYSKWVGSLGKEKPTAKSDIISNVSLSSGFGVGGYYPSEVQKRTRTDLEPSISFDIFQPSGETNLATGKPYGTYSAVETDKSRGTLFGVVPAIERRKSELVTEQMRLTDANMFKSFGIGVKQFGLGFAGAVAGFGGALLTPVKTAKNIFGAISKPKETAEGIRSYFEFGFKRNPSALVGEIAGTYATIKGVSWVGGRLKAAGQEFIMKNLPSYEPYGENIQILPTQTIRTNLRELRKIEGTKAITTHTTFAPELKYGSVLKEIPEGAGGLRKEIGQFGLFQYPSKERVVALGGYIGLGDDVSGLSKVKFSFLPVENKVFVFPEQYITPTPLQISAGMSAKELVGWQKSVGGTFIAPENIKLLSTEKQVVTAFSEGTFKISESSQKILGGFTYYPQYKESGLAIFQKGVGKNIYDIFTKRNVRINIYESELVRLKDFTGISGEAVAGVKFDVIDVGRYAESYGATKYISPVSVMKSAAPSIVAFSPIISNIKSKSSFSPTKSFGVSQISMAKSGIRSPVSSQRKGYSSYSQISRVSSLLSPSGYSGAYSPVSSVSGGYSVFGSYYNLPYIFPTYTPIKPKIKFLDVSKPRGQLGKQPTRYQPSFTGSVLNLRANIPKNYESYGFGGLRVRAVPITTRSSVEKVIKNINKKFKSQKKPKTKLQQSIKYFTDLERSNIVDII